MFFPCFSCDIISANWLNANKLTINIAKSHYVVFHRGKENCDACTGCAKKKKDILNIHIKSEGINIFSQKFYWTESTIFMVKC